MNTTKRRTVNYRTMTILALIAGISGFGLQFIPGGEILSFMLSVAVLGGLIGGSKEYEEQDRRQLVASFKTAYEWLLLLMMAAYAFILLPMRFSVMEGSVIFLNAHWPGLVISAMCLLLGLAGFSGTGVNRRG